MDYLTILNYGIQIILVSILLISLACKSWVLLTACLTIGLVLFGLACYKLIKERNQNSQNSQNYQANKTIYSNLKKQYFYPNYPSYPNYPNFIMSYQQPPPMQSSQFSQFSQLPPIQQTSQPQKLQPTHKRTQITMDEAMAKQIMTYADRTQTMQPGHLAVSKMRSTSNQNQGQTPYSDMYMIPIPGTKQTNKHVIPQQDPENPDNPMNSLSYLHPS
jgi:hypothetical protein